MTSLATAGLLLAPPAFSTTRVVNKIKAVAFDAFPIFDPRSIFKTITDLYPDKGKQLIEIWQTKQFSYQWLRLSGHRYKNFWEVTKDALEFALTQCQLESNEQTVSLVMDGYRTMNVWTDVPSSLEILKQQGLSVCFLSNMTEEMLRQGVRNAGIDRYFDHIISTDFKQTYKPGPEAYQMAIDKLKLKKEEILFVPFASWDMAGAKWFGYPTFWVNRLNTAMDNLDAEPDGTGNKLQDLITFINVLNKN